MNIFYRLLIFSILTVNITALPSWWSSWWPWQTVQEEKGQDEGIQRNFMDDIDVGDYLALKNAIFAIKPIAWQKAFNKRYPHYDQPSERALEALADEVPRYGLWQEVPSPKAFAFIDGKQYLLQGKIASIIYNYLQEKKQE